MVEENKVLNVAICINDVYEKHVGPFIHSMVRHTESHIALHIIYQELSEENIKRLHNLFLHFPTVTVEFHHLHENVISGLVESHHNTQFPVEIYFRFLLPEILLQLDKVLYIDVDTLICGDIAEIWTVDLKGHPLAAVKEVDIYKNFSWYLEKIGFGNWEGYFNSGVLLFDLNHMRQQQLSKKLIELAVETGNEYKFGDQDILNKVFQNHVIYLDKKFNYTQERMLTENLDSSELTIIHYNGAGHRKPWNNVATFPEQLRKYVWYYQQNRSEFRKLYYADQEKISILVASHNNEQFIEMALGSIVNQTYHQLEILVLDDGSTDNSYQRALDFAKFDRRIQVFQQENQGVSQTRRGLAMMATGSYSFYLDGDDWLEEGAIQALYSVLIENQSDIVIGQHYIYNQDAGKYITYTANDGMVEKISAIEAIQRQHDYNYVSFWGNLYTTNLLQKLEFCDAGLSDGLAMMYKLYLRANSIVYYRSTIYAHRKRSHQLYAYPDTELVNLFATTIKIYSEYLIKLLFLEIKNPTIEAEFRRKVLEMKEVLENRQLLTNTVYEWIQEKLES